MKLSTSTCDFGGFPGTGDIAYRLSLYKATPFKYINFEIGGNGLEDGNEEQFDKYIKTAKKAGEELGLTFVQAHGPNADRPYASEENYNKAIRVHTRLLEACAELGIPYVVIHANSTSRFSTDEFFDFNVKYYRDLIPAMEKTGVSVLTENMEFFEYYNLATGADMAELIDAVDHPLFGACWDISHANMCKKTKGVNSQYNSIMKLGDRLKALHVGDNFGPGPHNHTFPLEGTVSWDEIMNALIDVGYKGYFNFETQYTLRHSEWLPYKRRHFEYKGEDQTKLLNPPLHLKQEAVSLLYATGKAILEAYGCYEE